MIGDVWKPCLPIALTLDGPDPNDTSHIKFYTKKAFSAIWYHISSVIRWRFFLPKQSQRSRSVLQDGSRSLGLIRKGKIGIIAKFHRSNLVI